MSESSKAARQRWKNNLINKLGEEGFLAFQKEQLSQGSQFHELIQNYLSRQDINVSPDLEGCWESISKNVSDRVGTVEATEKKIAHPWLLYKGVVDCVAHFDGIPVVIEWKKSEKQKPKIKDTYDAPLQLTAYMSALSFDPQFNYQINGGLVVVAYTDGSPASVYPLKLNECTVYWTAWLKRLQKYWQIQNENLNN